MAIRLLLGRQIGAVGVALRSMRNPPCTLRFSDLYARDETLKPELLFLIVAFCGGILGFGKAGGFKNRGVMIGLSISAIAMLVVLFIEWEKLC
jgi:hypothetical protein